MIDATIRHRRGRRRAPNEAWGVWALAAGAVEGSPRRRRHLAPRTPRPPGTSAPVLVAAQDAGRLQFLPLSPQGDVAPRYFQANAGRDVL